ncbi:hypothetical protein WCE55_04345 [Luteimonas sp. MJ293]|uniref:hypothetical protein n=1 Tax=Luteimonas sp. MJ146 TaxID=3129240 RepID=UPI0031BAC87C
MSRSRIQLLRLLPGMTVLALALAACSGEGPEEGAATGSDPAPIPSAPAQPEPAPQLSEKMPVEGLEPDGRIASWAVAVQIGATMQALSAACDHHDDSTLRAARDDQRAQMVATGVDGERVDAVWDWAAHHAELKIAEQPAAELESGCARLIDMEEEAQRLGEAMRSALPGS